MQSTRSLHGPYSGDFSSLEPGPGGRARDNRMPAFRMLRTRLQTFALAIACCATQACGDDSVFTNYESFNVRSTGSGQLSTEAYRVNVTTGGVLQVKYLAPRMHCSNVKIHFLVDGEEKALSGAITPGTSSCYFDLGPVTAGSHEVGVQAEGILGGCNSGRLMSWQGSITVWTSPRRSERKQSGDRWGSVLSSNEQPRCCA